MNKGCLSLLFIAATTTSGFCITTGSDLVAKACGYQGRDYQWGMPPNATKDHREAWGFFHYGIYFVSIR